MLPIGLILIALAIAAFIYEKLDERRNYIFNHNKKHTSQVVLKWCRQNMNKNQSKEMPELILKYYTCKSKMGEYDFHGKVITIWIGKSTSVESLVSTIVHEFQHHLQLKDDCENERYNKLNSEYGYWKNPYEIDARNAEKKYTEKCIQYLIRKELIK